MHFGPTTKKSPEQEKSPHDALHDVVTMIVSGYLKNNLDKNNNPVSKHFTQGLKNSIASGIQIKNSNSKDVKVSAFLKYIDKQEDSSSKNLPDEESDSTHTGRSHTPLRDLTHTIAEDFTIDVSDTTKLEHLAEAVFQSEIDILIKRGQGGDIKAQGVAMWKDLDEVQKEKHRQNVEQKRQEQVRSIERWITYVSSGEVFYPSWYKYFVITSLRSMGVEQFELGTYTYGGRDQKTLFRFPTLNPAVLAKVYDRMLEAYTEENRSKSVPTKYEIHEAAKSSIDEAEKLFLEKYAKEANFSQLYAYELSKYKEVTIESRRSTEGLWVKYNQQQEGTKALKKEALKLSASLQDKGTEWCTEGVGFSESQLSGGDFYVYYTREDFDKDTYALPLEDMTDEEQKKVCTMPRIAIKMYKGTINELRGIVGGQEQDLEPEMLDIAQAKCQGDKEKKEEPLPGKEEYEKRARDMKQLFVLVKKQEKGIMLTRDELFFLYEVHGRIEGFGHKEDPRIEEIRSKRNRQEDIQTLCNCPKEFIAHDFLDITESTQVFCEDTGKKITFFDFREEKNKKKLPQLIELAKNIKVSGSPARPDMIFEGGIVDIHFDKAHLKDNKTAFEAFKQADDGTPHYIWQEWSKQPFIVPENNQFEVIVFSYNQDSNTRESSDKIVADMDKLGLRPLTLEEMTVAGISYPTFTKTQGRYFVGLTKYALVGGSCVPGLSRDDGVRCLNGGRWVIEWNDSFRFLCVRK